MKTLRSENFHEQILGLLLVAAGIALRVLPHADNFTPVTAVAFFGGVVLSPAVAFTVPLIIMVASDLWIGPHSLFLLTWGSFAVVTLFGTLLRRDPKWNHLLSGTLGASVFYFITTNLGVFVFENMYPKTWNGLVECFVMALPFFRNSVLADVFYSGVFFSLFFFAKAFSQRYLSAKSL